MSRTADLFGAAEFSGNGAFGSAWDEVGRRQTGARWFVRCVSCLSISCIEADRVPLGARCGLCDGTMESMGRVEGDRLVKEHLLCPCDGRCTEARGPLCVCKCGGKNHGSGLLVVVTRDAGAVPRISPRGSVADLQVARLRAERFKAAEALANDTRYALERKRQASWLERSDFDRLRLLEARLRELRKARTPEKRERMARLILEEVQS